MEKIRALGYIRVSGERQVVKGSSLTTQETMVKHYAMSRGYLLVRLFTEPGHSAKTDQRPALKELLKFCRSHRSSIDVVLFPKLDRFARYNRDYANLRHDLSQIGIRLESVTESFDDSPAGRFQENVLASVAQYDNELRAERAQWGLRQALIDGRWPYSAPPGYRRVLYANKWTIEPDPKTAKAMIEAFLRLAKRHHRPIEVRRYLAQNGIELSRAAFYRIIKKKLYIGQLEGKHETYQAVPPFVPLVSEQLFLGAQAALRQKKTPRSYDRDNPAFPLRGTLRCRCGRLLTACWSRGKTKRFAYYRCTHCQRVNIPGHSDIFCKAIG